MYGSNSFRLTPYRMSWHKHIANAGEDVEDRATSVGNRPQVCPRLSRCFSFFLSFSLSLNTPMQKGIVQLQCPMASTSCKPASALQQFASPTEPPSRLQIARHVSCFSRDILFTHPPRLSPESRVSLLSSSHGDLGAPFAFRDTETQSHKFSLVF